MAKLMHMTSLIWNLIVALITSIFSCTLSLSSRTEGNLPAFVGPSPKIRGNCLISVAEAKKLLYYFANFLMIMIYLLLLDFFNSFVRCSASPLRFVRPSHNVSDTKYSNWWVRTRVVWTCLRNASLLTGRSSSLAPVDWLGDLTDFAFEIGILVRDGLTLRELQRIVNGLSDDHGVEFAHVGWDGCEVLNESD
jgi:hypothetical protein